MIILSINIDIITTESYSVHYEIIELYSIYWQNGMLTDQCKYYNCVGKQTVDKNGVLSLFITHTTCYSLIIVYCSKLHNIIILNCINFVFFIF